MQALTGARLPGGEVADVHIEGERVAAVLPAGSPVPAGASRLSLEGWLLGPALTEPHTHLDKAFTADRVPPAADLAAAMAAYTPVLEQAGEADITARALRALRLLIAAGTTAVRTHVGCGRLLGTRAIRAVDAARRSPGAVGAHVQIVAHVGGPAEGETWRQHSRRLSEALDAGADLVGGNPSIEADPEAAMAACLQVAADRGVGVDLHIDETTDPRVLTLRTLARLAAQTDVPVTASHCVSLGAQEATLAAEVAAEVAEAGVSVVTLPATNLYLQGRGILPAPRGTTAAEALAEAGVRLAAGGDNVRDPFNPVGRLDPLETAALAVTALHRGVDEAWELVTGGARAVLGLAPAGPVAGRQADLLAIRAESLAEAVALAPAERMVWHRGAPMVRTDVQHTWEEPS